MATNVTSLRTQGGANFLAFAKNKKWDQVRVVLWRVWRVVCVVCGGRADAKPTNERRTCGRPLCHLLLTLVC